jgi:hypothetical protein
MLKAVVAAKGFPLINGTGKRPVTGGFDGKNNEHHFHNNNIT